MWNVYFRFLCKKKHLNFETDLNKLKRIVNFLYNSLQLIIYCKFVKFERYLKSLETRNLTINVKQKNYFVSTFIPLRSIITWNGPYLKTNLRYLGAPYSVVWTRFLKWEYVLGAETFHTAPRNAYISRYEENHKIIQKQTGKLMELVQMYSFKKNWLREIFE